MITRRKSDLILEVTWHSKSGILLITALSSSLEEMLQYTKDELIGKELKEILPLQEWENIEEMIEEGAYASANALTKLRKISLVKANGNPMPLRVKIFQSVSNRETITYQWLMREGQLYDKIITLKQRLKSKRQCYLSTREVQVENHLFFAILEMIHEEARHSSLAVTIGLCDMDHYQHLAQAYGEGINAYCAEEVRAIIKGCLREEDMVFYLQPMRFAVILLECGQDESQKVWDRIHRKMHTSPITISPHMQRYVSISIGYASLAPEKNILEVLANCDEALTQGNIEGGNSIRAAS